MWISALTDLLPKKLHGLNIKAFEEGKKRLSVPDAQPAQLPRLRKKGEK
jgi:hypothetical protein